MLYGTYVLDYIFIYNKLTYELYTQAVFYIFVFSVN